MKRLISAVLITLLFAIPSTAEQTHETNVYWGDTHLHTGLSFDAWAFGTGGTPDLAYRYAKGQPVIHPILGNTVKIDTPLDFLIIADHAEVLGTIPRLFQGDAPEVEKSKTGQYLLEIAKNRTQEEFDKVYNTLNAVGSGTQNDSGLTPLDLLRDVHGENIRSAWVDSVKTADEHNQPGKFTAMIGWEWTSQPGGANLHRVIFMPDNAEKVSQFLPLSTLETDDPEKLWEWLDTQERTVGTEFLAIPHGSNISNGLMFSLKRKNGEPIDKVYAQTQSRFEPAIEITQIKGDSEAHPLFAPEDQFADYEPFNFLSTPDKTIPDPKAADYVRSGFRNGLILASTVGVNPYKMGMAAGTDSHVGISAVAEDDFAGKSGHDALPKKRSAPSGIGASVGWDMGAAGFTAVWAKENTRQAIFDAFRRKEIYASTGPRITLRFFGGFDLKPENADLNNMVRDGYSMGVPMGGDLDVQKADAGKAPAFTVAVTKAPNGANLDRVQIIKGWLKADGTTKEKIYDVALSDKRTDGNVAVGNTVNLEDGSYTNDIGDPALSAYWQDPDFDKSQMAFYYVRALEIPTPRYSLLDAIALGMDYKETGRPATIQERVYSSPIWYTP